MQFSVRKSLVAFVSVALGISPLVAISPAQAALLVTVTPPMTTTQLGSLYNGVSLTPRHLADFLVGGGSTGVSQSTGIDPASITNVKYTGASAQAGIVDIADPNVVAFNHGLIMSSGDIANVIGPNKSDSITGYMAGQPGFDSNGAATSSVSGGGDTDLTNLISQTQTVNPNTYDAATLEFDFVPTASTVYFTYTFGSDEYLEWVNLFNDVFAFYINDNVNPVQNCAYVPNPDTSQGASPNVPVSIDTINSTVNPSLFRDNAYSYPQPATNPLNLELDGISVEMICSAHVHAGSSNHMKLAISDTSDGILDSVVMIKAGSLSTVPPEACNDDQDNDGDSAKDMADTDCQNSTTPAPPNQPSGTGSTTTVTPPVVTPPIASGPTFDYKGAPAFTGTEGTPILLDASVFGWKVSTGKPIGYASWQVYSKTTPKVYCQIIDPTNSAQGKPAVTPGGDFPVAFAICPNEGTYQARVDSWANDDLNDSQDDRDVDFKINNAPPALTIDSPANNQQVLVNTPVTISATAVDPGTNDSVSCSIKWGDGSETSNITPIDGVCSADHTYTSTQDALVTVSAKDNANSTAGAASIVKVVTVIDNTTPQTISVTTDAPSDAFYGDGFYVDATGGSSGTDLIYGSSGGCINYGNYFAMTSGTVDCAVTIDQTGATVGDVIYADAPQVTYTVSAKKIPLTLVPDALSKNWGESDPTFTYALSQDSWLAWSDEITGSLSRVQGEGAGSYDITLGDLTIVDTQNGNADASSNYDITLTPTTFAILGELPTVTTNPTDRTVAKNTLATFTAAATSTPAATVQWQVLPVDGSWTDISGATSTTYSFTATPGDSGKKFRAIFDNGVGTSTTSEARLSVPSITSFTPTIGAVGSTVVLTGTGFVGATTVKFNGVTATSFTVNSDTSVSAVVPTLAAANSGTIAVAHDGVTATSTTNFTVGTLPSVTTSPANASVTRTSTATFSVVAAGSPTPTIQWQSLPVGGTWSNIPSATATSYTTAASTTAMNGTQYRAVLTNAVGSTTSNAATLSVFGVTSFSPTAIAAGITVTITGTNLTGVTGVTFGTKAGTSVTVVNSTTVTAVVPAAPAAGTITLTKTTPAQSTVSPTSYTIGVKPAMTTQPTAQTAVAGGTVTFTAAGSGTPAPTVQWQVSPTGTTGVFSDIVGATSATYSFTASTADNAKAYRAVFTNALGSVTSSAVALSVVSITSFSPTSGPAGTVVTITGVNLTGTTAARFNGVAAATPTVTATTVTATVPATATTGAISLTRGTLTLTTATNFTVIPSPLVSAITPTTGGPGLNVTLTGTNFTGVTSVKFSGTASSAPFTILSATSILTSVPAGSTTGPITVTNSYGSGVSANFTPTATLTVPTVTAYSTSSTRAGIAATTTVTGTNFGGVTAVKLNGVTLSFTIVSATTLSATIPATGVTTGPIRVTTAGGTSVNVNNFSVNSAPTKVAAGTSHACAVLADGSVKCWGLNTNGQLGNGTTTQSTSPVLVTAISNATALSAGSTHTCAVLADGTAKCWGQNASGQIGNGVANATNITAPTAVLAAASTSLTNVSAIAAGTSFTCAVINSGVSGTAKCWGLNTNGQLGNGTTTSSSYPTTVLASSGVTLTGVVAISTGTSHACAILSSGAVKCWGLNTNGQLGNGSTTQSAYPVAVTGIDGNASKASVIDLGASHSCVVIVGGTAKCWGLNTNGQLGNGTTTQSTTPVTVLSAAATNLTNVSSLSSGAAFTCAIIGSGSGATAKCWGLNTNGQLGNASTTQNTYPVNVVTTLTTGISQLCLGAAFVVAVIPSTSLAPSTVGSWGVNTNGQLGNASTTQSTSPVALSTL